MRYTTICSSQDILGINYVYIYRVKKDEKSTKEHWYNVTPNSYKRLVKHIYDNEEKFHVTPTFYKPGFHAVAKTK